jgi:hypothetical protein
MKAITEAISLLIETLLVLLNRRTEKNFSILAKVLGFFTPLRFAKKLGKVPMASSGDFDCHVSSP